MEYFAFAVHKLFLKVYAGPVYGYAQVALAYSANLANKKATIFVQETNPMHPLTKKAKELGAKIHEIGPPGYLQQVQQEAEKYTEKIKEEQGNNYIENFEFGLFSAEFVWILAEQIKNALGLSHKPPKRVWLVVGSGAILAALHQVWPETLFLLVQVGKWIKESLLEGINHQIFIAPEKFAEKAVMQPPYSSVSNYDAKLWQFVVKEGQDNDFIWNVGKDPEP